MPSKCPYCNCCNYRPEISEEELNKISRKVAAELASKINKLIFEHVHEGDRFMHGITGRIDEAKKGLEDALLDTIMKKGLLINGRVN